MIVRTLNGLQALTTPSPTWTYGGHGGGSLDLYGASSATYGSIYRTQPNIRTCVDFMARNVAQLGIHVFRRVSDTDRVRLPDHDLAQWLDHPNPATTRYRLIESLMQDLGIYFNAYWLKVRSAPMGLVRIPPHQMHVEGSLLPTAIVWTAANGQRRVFDPSEVVHFGGYDPDHPLMGLSPLETLRRILAEEAAAGAYREAFWGNSARIEGVIERPVTAPKWTPAQKQSWRDQWQAAYGAGGSRAGSVAVLEDGMTLKPTGWSAKDSEFLASRKLTREECAAAYHIPLPFVGILDHATFSNIREQHKNLYQDALGPWLEMIQAELERQLLPDSNDALGVYVEFNIAEKLKGSFEEQATSLQTLVGRPVMTANEGRARLNLSSTGNPKDDELAPQQGGPAAVPGVGPADTATPPAGGRGVPAENEPEIDGHVTTVIQAMQARLQARLDKLPADDRYTHLALDTARWRTELATDLTPLLGAARADDRAARVLIDVFARLRTEERDAA